jgi:hypothetical protein
MGRLPLIEVGPVFVNHALTITHDHISAAHAHCLNQLGAGDRRSAGAVHHDLDIAELAASDLARVDQPRRGDDCSAVLVVVKDRDVHPLTQSLFNDEAGRSRNVLEVDPAKGRLEQLHRVDEPLRVLGRDFDVDCVDVGEAFEEHRFAFHHRLGGERAQIAEAEDRRAVGDHSDEVALAGIVVGAGRILGDSAHRNSDSRRISEAQIALRRHRLRRRDFDLSGPAARMEIERFGFGVPDVSFGHGRRLTDWT